MDGKQNSFKRFTINEFRQLQELSKAQIIAEIRKRGGVRRPRPSGKRVETSSLEIPTCRIVIRHDKFYMHIENMRIFTLKKLVDIRPIPTPLQIKSSPETWWHSSKHADFLRLELESSKCYLTSAHLGASMYKSTQHSHAVSHFCEIIRTSRLSYSLIDHLEHELGRDTLVGMIETAYQRKSNAESIRPVIDQLTSTPKMNTPVRSISGEEREERERNCINWEDEKSPDWRLTPDYLSMFDSHSLCARFESRHGRVAKKLRESILLNRWEKLWTLNVFRPQSRCEFQPHLLFCVWAQLLDRNL